MAIRLGDPEMAIKLEKGMIGSGSTRTSRSHSSVSSESSCSSASASSSRPISIATTPDRRPSHDGPHGIVIGLGLSQPILFQKGNDSDAFDDYSIHKALHERHRPGSRPLRRVHRRERKKRRHLPSFKVLLVYILGTVLLSVAIFWTLVTLSYSPLSRGRFITGQEIAQSGEQPAIIPKIIHQTWKDDRIPEAWQPLQESCRKTHSDYEFKLWTDQGSRNFLAQHYPWFLETFDNYRYDIQRADSIRYFVLYHYGGAYLDLDVGCTEVKLDSLLQFQVVLPQTKPVGVSNDVILSQARHPFMDQLIYALPSYANFPGSKYVSVMFGTGPMFLSRQMALYNDPSIRKRIRVLPRDMYGKHSEKTLFFKHAYGSSWHGQDADVVKWVVFKHGHQFGFVILSLIVLASMTYRHHRSMRLGAAAIDRVRKWSVDASIKGRHGLDHLASSPPPSYPVVHSDIEAPEHC